ncbi:hypothetical protein SDC9_183499 [bioreactor metagenome]|uniref:Uncharacterized protein n=1 Tax=bioreactor metagenome TaxID=1076179 RepID=A0A645HIP5_9ZZZZ
MIGNFNGIIIFIAVTVYRNCDMVVFCARLERIIQQAVHNHTQIFRHVIHMDFRYVTMENIVNPFCFCHRDKTFI